MVWTFHSSGIYRLSLRLLGEFANAKNVSRAGESVWRVNFLLSRTASWMKLLFAVQCSGHLSFLLYTFDTQHTDINSIIAIFLTPLLHIVNHG